MGSGHSYLMEMPVAAPAPVAPVAPVAFSLQELYHKCKSGAASLEEEPNYMLQDLYNKHCHGSFPQHFPMMGGPMMMGGMNMPY